MQITRRKDTMIALAALGASFGAGALTVTTASADTAGLSLAKNVGAGSFDLTKQVSGTMTFPVMFDRPSGVNAAALAGAVKGLGTNSTLYKSALNSVPELAGDTSSLLNDALDSGSGNYGKARETIVKLINWYNTLGGQKITTQGGAAYTTGNLDQPINVLAVGFSNNNSVNQAATNALANINAARNTGDVMRALDAIQSGLSVPFSTAFSNYASKVYASGANMNDLTQISAVQPVLNAYEGMYANGASAIRKSLLSGQASSTEAGVAFFESAVLAGNSANSGSDGTGSNTPTDKTQYSTRWVDESGNELTTSETSETGYAGAKTFNGYELVSEDVNEDTHTKTYHYKKHVETPAKQVVTHWVDTQGNKLKADENGQHPDNDGKSDIPGWDLVSVKTDNDGNVTNTYKKHEEPVKKVVTHWVDEQGNKLKDDQEGQFPDNDGVSDIPGWDLVRTTTDTDGNVTNVYRKHEEPTKKVVTHWVDEEGNKLKDDEDGQFPDNDGVSDIPGWDLVRTTTDTDGNVTNVYKKHEEPTQVLHTYWVSTTGDTLKDPEEGSYPDNDGVSDIEGWDLTTVYTVTDEDLAKGGSLEGTNYKAGDIINIYKKHEEPTKQVVTHWVDEQGNKLKDDENGSFPDNDGKSDIPGYTLVSVKTDPDGNVTNTYKKNEEPAKKVVTHWVDIDGNKLKDDQDGSFPDTDGVSDIDGYTLVSVKTDADGNVTNTYKKKTHTSWVDENGKKLKDDEDGNHPDDDGKSDIPGYELVSTTTDKDGNTINTYKKKVVTHWVDVDGKKLKADEDGSFPDNDGKSDISGYELVSTTTDKDGNVTNTYKKKTHTSWVDENGKKLKADEDGNHPDDDGKSDIPGYELVSTTTDKDGNTINTYKKKEAPAPAPAPVAKKTETPAPEPAPAPEPTPAPASAPAPAAKKLPQTGEEGAEELGAVGASLMGMAAAISAVAVRGKKRKED